MTIAASYSKFSKQNIIIGIVFCIVAAGWLYYDGYHNRDFVDKHTSDENVADSTLQFHRKAPPFLIAGAVLLSCYFFYLKDKKIVLEEKELVLSNKKRITLSSIEKIDRTYFDSKGYFTMTYKDSSDQIVDLKLCGKKYDNLGILLDELVSKIS